MYTYTTNILTEEPNITILADYDCDKNYVIHHLIVIDTLHRRVKDIYIKGEHISQTYYAIANKKIYISYTLSEFQTINVLITIDCNTLAIDKEQFTPKDYIDANEFLQKQVPNNTPIHVLIF